jgi:hypothetical protein
MMVRRFSALVLFAATGAALGACQDDPVFVRLPEPEVQIDELKQKPAALVDILWVVDNSDSMVEEQQLLATNFERFISGLTLCQGTGVDNDLCDFDTRTCRGSGQPCNPPDYHIGVISTDITEANQQIDKGQLRLAGVCVPSSGATPTTQTPTYCQGSNAECTDPANPFCDMNQAITFVTPTTPNAPAAFARIVDVGTAGGGRESGFTAASIAVGKGYDRDAMMSVAMPSRNQGFLRTDASLFIIFVSDEEDQSFGEPTYYYRTFETLKGPGNEGLVSLSSIVGPPSTDASGTNPGGCSAPQFAAPGTRYVALSMYSRGLSGEFRVCDGTRLTCPTGQACQAPVPNLPGVCVPSGQCQVDQDCGNFKCGDDIGCVTCENNACNLKGDLFLQLLERNGIFGSICDADYGRVLNALGFEAAGLSRKFELTKFPDCSKGVCCGVEDAEGNCDTPEVPVCVRVNGEVIANNRASGWVYEAGGNAVFFDGTFVPPTDADIQVSYRIAPGDEALSCDAALQ